MAPYKSLVILFAVVLLWYLIMFSGLNTHFHICVFTILLDIYIERHFKYTCTIFQQHLNKSTWKTQCALLKAATSFVDRFVIYILLICFCAVLYYRHWSHVYHHYHHLQILTSLITQILMEYST